MVCVCVYTHGLLQAASTSPPPPLQAQSVLLRTSGRDPDVAAASLVHQGVWNRNS